MHKARARILFDAFYHMLPGHRLGPHIVTGGYAMNCGRYTPGDCGHPNGLAHLQAGLSDRFDLRLLTQPYSDLSLFDADVLLVANPDYPLYEGAAPYRWTPADVNALVRFLERGGGVLLTVNSFLPRPDFWKENFDLERVSLLFDRLGLRWDPNYMSDDKNLETARAGRYRIAYGQGGRVCGGALPPGVKPLLTRDANIYGFRTRIGAGSLAVLGDSGMITNGLTCFPGYDNLDFLVELFDSLRPAWMQKRIRGWDYVASGSLSSAPSEHGLSERILRDLRPQADWIKDHHFRHLVWTVPEKKSVGDEVWKLAPVALDRIGSKRRVSARLHWLRLDSDRPGPAFKMDLTATVSKTRDGADVHLIGRHVARGLVWPNLCEQPETMRAAGEVELVSAVFELRAALNPLGRPLRARWTQGQRLFARNAKSLHGGYENVHGSASGAIVPRAKQ